MYTNKVETKEKIKYISDKKLTATYTVFIRLTALGAYSWVARDVTKNQTKKLSILLSFYFHEVLQYLNIFT